MFLSKYLTSVLPHFCSLQDIEKVDLINQAYFNYRTNTEYSGLKLQWKYNSKKTGSVITTGEFSDELFGLREAGL